MSTGDPQTYRGDDGVLRWWATGQPVDMNYIYSHQQNTINDSILPETSVTHCPRCGWDIHMRYQRPPSKLEKALQRTKKLEEALEKIEKAALDEGVTNWTFLADIAREARKEE
jgi:hypothetical protein